MANSTCVPIYALCVWKAAESLALLDSEDISDENGQKVENVSDLNYNQTYLIRITVGEKRKTVEGTILLLSRSYDVLSQLCDLFDDNQLTIDDIIEKRSESDMFFVKGDCCDAVEGPSASRVTNKSDVRKSSRGKKSKQSPDYEYNGGSQSQTQKKKTEKATTARTSTQIRAKASQNESLKTLQQIKKNRMALDSQQLESTSSLKKTKAVETEDPLSISNEKRGKEITIMREQDREEYQKSDLVECNKESNENELLLSQDMFENSDESNPPSPPNKDEDDVQSKYADEDTVASIIQSFDRVKKENDQLKAENIALRAQLDIFQKVPELVEKVNKILDRVNELELNVGPSASKKNSKRNCIASNTSEQNSQEEEPDDENEEDDEEDDDDNDDDDDDGLSALPGAFPIKPTFLSGLSKERPRQFVLDLMQGLYSRKYLIKHKMTGTAAKIGDDNKLPMKKYELDQIIEAVIQTFPKMKKAEITSAIRQKFNQNRMRKKRNSRP